MADNHAVRQLLQVRYRPVLEHEPALKGRSRQHQHMDAPLLEGTAGGRPHRVVKDGAVHRQHGLLDVVGGHLFPHLCLKPAADFIQNVLVQLQLPAKGFTDGLFGQIVVSRPQTAGGNNDVRPPAGNLQSVRQTLRVVPHHRVVVDRYPQGAETLGDHLRVGIGDVAQEQFRTDRNQFRCMGHSDSSFLLFGNVLRFH